MIEKKAKKDFWEEMFEFPSFNIRFGYTLLFVSLVFLILGWIVLFKLELVSGSSDHIAVVNLLVQLATLVLGVFATYYALRQLVETRFNGLDESGMQELRRNHYSRAFEKWREAFYIKPDAVVFTNMCEALLLLGDYEKFDQYVRMSEKTSFQKKGILTEPSDRITLRYLRVARSLLEENQGEAKKHINEIVALVKEHKLIGFAWDFIDIQQSINYQTLEGDCRTIFDNLISYLSKKMPSSIIEKFEEGQYTIQEEILIPSVS